MKPHRSRALTFTLIATLGLAVQPTLSQCLSIHDPLTTNIQGWENRGGRITAANPDPAEAWRQRTVELLNVPITQENAVDRFRYLSNGAFMGRGVGRQFVREYLVEVPSSQLTPLFRCARPIEFCTLTIIETKLMLAEEIISRSDLSSIHSEAIYDRACMRLLKSRTAADALNAFNEARESGPAQGDFRNKAQSAYAVLTDPTTPADYREAIALMNLCEKSRTIVASGFVAAHILSKIDANGAEYFRRSSFAGDDAPLLAANLACFEYGRTRQLGELLAVATADTGLSEGSLSKIRYYTAMDHFSNHHTELAIPLFQAVTESASEPVYAAWSIHFIGECYFDQRDWMNAAVYHMDAIENCQQYPDIVKRSTDAYNMIINTGKADVKAVALAYKAKHTNSQITMKSSAYGVSR